MQRFYFPNEGTHLCGAGRLGDADRPQVEEDLSQWSAVSHSSLPARFFLLHLGLSDRAKLVRTNCASLGFYPQCQGTELRRASVGVKT